MDRRQRSLWRVDLVAESPVRRRYRPRPRAAAVQLVQTVPSESLGGSLKYKPRPYWTGMLVLLPSLLASPVYCNQPSNLYYGCSLERPRRGRADTNRPATFTNGGTTISSYGYLGFLGLGLGAGAAAVEGACRGAGMMGGCTLLLPLSFSCACLFHSCCYRRARWAGLGFCRPWHVLAGRLGTRRRGLWFSEPVSVIPLLESSDL